ncbi:hypothetical protein SAY87_014578 [Trapa incisa]|uniref:Hydroxyphenylpyruvate reductase n=1 Tax=Trapa incisa TaxID=236973 RepID=A0AAN7GWD3_9MYRT|nr:hypothetical protein SAY87_014578 [Trapa incisa]
MASPSQISIGDALPQVLLLRNLLPFSLINKPLPDDRFHFLRAWESSVPLDEFVLANAQSARAVVTSGGAPVTADLLRMLPDLQFVLTTTAGLNHIDLDECRRRGIAVANAAGVFSEDVAEVAVCLLIDVWRRISAGDRYIRAGRWVGIGAFPLGFKLRGKRVGIVGLGRIGMEVAKRLDAFGCIISYNSRNQKTDIAYPFFPNLRDLASNSDALVICCGLTDETHHMIDKEVMMTLGKEGVIVNIGRGPIIDEKEMVELLVKGELGGAGLDVFENEPDVPKELMGLDNVVMTPHCGALTRESFLTLCELVVGNLEAFFSNRPLLSQVQL